MTGRITRWAGARGHSRVTGWRLRALALVLVIPALSACSQARGPAGPPPRPTARAIALRAAQILVPYLDPLHTFEVQRPQTWVAMDGRSAPEFAHALGDGVRFFEPITAADPDAGSSGKLWIDVLPARASTTPRQILLQPFVAADYPDSLLARMSLALARLGGVPAYRLVTLAGRTQITLLLARRGAHYYRVTVFSATIPAEVAPVLRSWRFLDERHAGTG